MRRRYIRTREVECFADVNNLPYSASSGTAAPPMSSWEAPARLYALIEG